MDNESVPQQTPVGTPSQQTINTNKQKVSLSPFPHLKKGLSSLIKNNLSSGLIAILISSVVSVGVTIAFMYAAFFAGTYVFINSLAISEGGSSSGLIKLLAIVLGVAILAACVTGYFSSVITRIIITGSRGQKENVGHAFSFVLSRLPKIILTYLLVFAIFLAAGVVVGLSSKISPVVALLLGIVGLIAGLIFVLRISYLPLILVDDEDPGRPMTAIRRSTTLWKISSGALVVYYLIWFVIYIVLNALIGNKGSNLDGSAYSSSTSLLQTPGFTFGIGAVLISSFIGNCFGALVYSGAASIYNDAREIIGGNLPQSPSIDTNAAAAPAPPTAAGPAAPVAS